MKTSIVFIMGETAFSPYPFCILDFLYKRTLIQKIQVCLPRQKGGIFIAIYHCSIKIISRGKGKSAVAAAAYRSGEKLTNNYDGTIHDYTKKGGIAHTEIILPSHAPPEFSDRSTLWNSVEKIEKSKNSQLAREFEIAIPKELTPNSQIELVREYIKQNFVSVGMCADFAIHDKKDGNPHAHIMLTMRPIEQDGSWGAKSKKEYITDKNGERVKLKNGNFKTRKIDAVDWNDKEKAELWRSKWAEISNRYLSENYIDKRIDHRSFERQGIEQVPTIHLGVAASQMERKGVQTERGNINREIQTTNRFLAEIMARLASLKKWLADFFKHKKAPSAEQNLVEILQELAKPKKVNFHYSVYNPRKLAAQMQYLQNSGIATVPQLDERIKAVRGQYDNIRIDIKATESKLHRLTEIVKQADIYSQYKELYEQYISQTDSNAALFRYEHYSEITIYEAAVKFLKENLNDGNLNPEQWKTELAKLTDQKDKMYDTMYGLRDELKTAEELKKSIDAEMRRTARNKNNEYER